MESKELPNFYLDENIRRYFNSAIHITYRLLEEQKNQTAPNQQDILFCTDYFLGLLRNIEQGVDIYKIISEKHSKCRLYLPELMGQSQQTKNITDALNEMINFLKNYQEDKENAKTEKYLRVLDIIIEPLV